MKYLILDRNYYYFCFTEIGHLHDKCSGKSLKCSLKSVCTDISCNNGNTGKYTTAHNIYYIKLDQRSSHILYDHWLDINSFEHFMLSKHYSCIKIYQ